MRYLNVLLLVCVTLFCCSCGLESSSGTGRYTLEQFLNTTSYVGGTFSFDERRILFSSNETGIFNAYSMSLHSSSKDYKATRVTNSSDHSVFALSFFPDDDRVLYCEDENGNEIDHIYVREGNGGIRDLTPGPTARAEFYGWAHDRRSFLYGTNARDPKYMDIYEMDIDTFESKLLFHNDGGYIFGCLSPNKRYLALSKIVSTTQVDMYIYDTETALLINKSPQTPDSELQPQAFSPDSNALYYLTDEDSDFSYVKKLDIASNESTVEYREPWDIIGIKLSHNGTYHVVTVNEEARISAKIFHHHSKARMALPKILEDNVVRVEISRSEKRILFSVNSDTSPTNLFLYEVEKKAYKQLTKSLSPDMDPAALVTAQAVRYRSADGLAIPALWYKPKGASEGSKVPALIWVHGGPGGQSTRTYNYLIQYLVNQGYATLAVNNRGSSGYGKSFYCMADRKHGEVDLQDCLDGKKFLINTGIVDPEKIGIMGGSYGGYMTLAALAFRPDEMAVGIDLFGVSNWLRTLESIPSWWEMQRQMMYQKIGHPEEDREYLISISPLFHAEKITKPLMVLQGANDPRVLRAESDEIIAAIDNSGIPYRYLIFDDEGHGFTKDRNRLLAGKAIMEFLREHL